MPYARVFNPSLGQVMNAGELEAELVLVRSWLNSVPNADITGGTIPREAIVRPEVGGAPDPGYRSTFELAAWSRLAIDKPDRFTNREWGTCPERLTIIPRIHDGTTGVWRTPIGRTFFALSAFECTVAISFDLTVRTPTAGPYYPDGTGLPIGAALGGFFQVYVYDRDGLGAKFGTETPIISSIREVYPTDFPPGHPPETTYNDHVVMYATLGALSAGHTYDVQLVYDLDTGSESIDQLDLTRIHFELEGV